MGAEQPMMRARQRGGGCRVPGHGSWCELATERPPRGRRDDHQARDRDIEVQRADDEIEDAAWLRLIADDGRRWSVAEVAAEFDVALDEP